MAFTFPVNVEELIGERASQWIGIGVPAQVIADVQSRVVDMWLDGPGGWAYEWSAAASDAEQTGELVQASLLYGIAKFPVLAGEAHRKAYANQLRTLSGTPELGGLPTRLSPVVSPLDQQVEDAQQGQGARHRWGRRGCRQRFERFVPLHPRLLDHVLLRHVRSVQTALMRGL
jgi:hypothetical protein